MKAVEITLDRKQMPLRLTKDGQVQDFVLQEIDGATRDKWLSKNRSRMKVSPDGKTAMMADPTGAQAELIAMHLFNAELEDIKDGNGDVVETRVVKVLDQVKESVIQGFSNSAQMFLLEQSNKISGLGAAMQEVKEEEGNG